MSETDSFTDPVFLARFGLSRVNAIDYFLHPLNPFRTKVHTSNEVLAMQGIGIGILMQQGSMTHAADEKRPLSPIEAEAEYNQALSRLPGEQYELLPPSEPSFYTQPSPLYTIRHVLRTSPSSVKVLGIYYIVEGIIYKAPAVRSVMKTNTTRILTGLAGACRSLSPCARYHPSVGYTWVFEKEEEMDPVALMQLAKKRKRRKILDSRRPGERTAAEEEGIRASEAMDQILVRLSRSPLFAKSASSKKAGSKEMERR